MKEDGKKEGHKISYLGICTCVGLIFGITSKKLGTYICLGVAIGFALDNIFFYK